MRLGRPGIDRRHRLDRVNSSRVNRDPANRASNDRSSSDRAGSDPAGGRDLTQDEWDRFVPGDEPRQSACDREIIDEVTEVEAASNEPSFAIETMVAFESEPATGTFEVTAGSDNLGCSGGTLVENGGPDGITNEFMCQDGPGEGAFTIEWQIDDTEGPGAVNGPWTVIDATGDFVGLTGEGIWSGFEGDGPIARGGFLGEIEVGA